MLDGITAQEWARLLPGPPRSTSSATDIGDILQEMESTRFVDVVSAVLLPVAWPGIVEPEDEIQEQIIVCFGRWCVTEHTVVCVGEGVWISTDRLDEEDWLDPLLQKNWLYDPSDLVLALEQARALAIPDIDRAQHRAAIDTQLNEAIRHGHLVFHPTVLRRDHIYLVHSMLPEEREAFYAFLTDEGFVAR